MVAALHTVSFPGAIVQRGFWLYVWRVATPKGMFHYVGRTGDNPSPKATAPYTRMGQHLGYIKTQNALRKHLKKKGLEPDECERFDLICYGPLFPEVSEPDMDRDGLMERHTPIRNVVGALEKALAEALSEAGYEVLNTVKWRHDLDATLWPTVKAAFTQHFPRLNGT
jgi:hypothetical protein